MDMIPPQAPPAHTQTVYQEASDAFDRILGLQGWLANEQAGLPFVPEVPEPGNLPSYLLAMDGYWSVSRRTAIARHVAAAARDLATLAHHDGNLDARALATVRSVAAAGEPAPGITVREPLFGGIAIAGSLLVQDERVADRVLLFSADRGWEIFPRLVDAHAELERRARLTLVRSTDLPGIARQHLDAIAPETLVDSREITGNPFDNLVGRLIDVQRDKLHQAWFEHSITDESGAGVAGGAFADATWDALRLDQMFDVEAVLAFRHATLVATFNNQRLERVPANVAADWRSGEDIYTSALDAILASEVTTTLPVPMDLAGYASHALGERLRALGVTEDPADIQVRVDRGVDVNARLASLQALFEGPAPEHIRLTDLAYQNIASFEPVRLSASTSEGAPIVALNDAAIRSLIRDLDLSSRYPAYIDSTFRSGSSAAMHRAHASSMQAAHMGLLAAEARLAYYLDDAPRSFLPDRAERGHRWVQAVLDAPAAEGRARVEGHEIVVRQITYQGTPLRDILSVGVRDPESVASIVLYTPDAPDGITFREFADRAEAGRKFFYQPEFREYLLDRLPAEYARMLPNGSAREFAGDHLSSWVLGSASTAAYTRTQAPFEEREVGGDFLAAAYEVDVQLGLRNAQAFTRSAQDANWAWLVERFQTDTAHRVVGDVIKGVVTAPARAAQAAWRLYDNVKAGDHGQAVVDFAEFYNASLLAAHPVYALGATRTAHAIAGPRFRAGSRLVEAGPAPQSVTFDPRYLAKNIRKTGHPDHEGVFAIQGKTYIEHGKRMYRVVRDSDYAAWRLSRPDAGPFIRGPAIERTAAGTWGYRQVGLRGGTGRGAGSAHRLPDLYDELQAEVELAFPDPVERGLVATRMRFERAPYDGAVMPPPPNIAQAQRIRWAEALTHARMRQIAREIQPGLPAPAAAVDLRATSGAAAPYRVVSRAEAPAELWYYDNRPFLTSTLERTRGNSGDVNMQSTKGYSNDLANIAARRIEGDVHGIRLTTVPPTAPIHQINEAMGTRHLTRAQAFAVRVDPMSLFDPLSPIVARRYWGGGPGSNAEVLVPRTGPGNVFIARPNGGGPLRLGRGQFDVSNTLPPEAP